MHRLVSLGCFLAIAMTVSLAESAPPWAGKGFHPIRAVKAKWRKERALHKLEKIIRAKPRLAVKFRERYGKLGGKKQFGTKGDWTKLALGTAVTVGGAADPEHAAYYVITSTLLNLGTFGAHVFSRKRMRRKTIISMIEDKTISDTDLKPFREALGLNARNRRLTPRPPEPEPETAPNPPPR
jgi:hypothetical protein